MIEDIVLGRKGSLREKVMTYFFSNPDTKLHLRAIANKLDVHVGNLSSLLKPLAEDELFLTETLGSLKLFSLNHHHPLFDGLKMIVDRTTGIMPSLKNLFADLKGVKRAFIYGSFAKGEEKGHSDIDVLVVFLEAEFDSDQLLTGLNALEEKFDRVISPVTITEKSLAKRLQENESFFTSVLAGPKLELIDAA